MIYACLSFRQQAWGVERVHLAFEQVVLLALCSADYTTAPAQGISLEKKKGKKEKAKLSFQQFTFFVLDVQGNKRTI